MAYKKRTTPDGKPIWMPIWVAECLADTRHLSPAEFGCLQRLTLSYWHSGPPRDDDEKLARICGCPLSDWKRDRPAIAAYFEVGGGQWTSERIDDELAKAYALINKNKKRTEKATAAAATRHHERLYEVRNDDRNGQRNGITGRDKPEGEAGYRLTAKPPIHAGFEACSSVADSVTINQLQVNSNPALAKALNGCPSHFDGGSVPAVQFTDAMVGEVRHG